MVVLVCQCPCCDNVFFVNYVVPHGVFNIYDVPMLGFEQIIGGHAVDVYYDETIATISSDFIKIFNDSCIAEQEGCKSIVGLGYRRALEFLVKDYAIKFNDKDKEEIAVMHLSDVIKKYLDSQTQELFKKTTWIGNDYSHYSKEYENIDIDDLKQLVLLSADAIKKDVKIREYMSKIKHKSNKE